MEVVTLPFELAATGLEIEASRAEGSIKNKISEYNAVLDRRQADASLKRRIEEAQLLRRRAKRDRATNIAKGAPLLVLEENAVNARIDELRTLEAGIVEHGEFESQAEGQLLQGRLAKRTAKVQRNKSLLQGANQITKAGAGALSFGIGI